MHSLQHDFNLDTHNQQCDTSLKIFKMHLPRKVKSTIEEKLLAVKFENVIQELSLSTEKLLTTT